MNCINGKQIIAIDCDWCICNGVMMLTKISVVDFYGHPILNTFVRTSTPLNEMYSMENETMQQNALLFKDVLLILIGIFYNKIIIAVNPLLTFHFLGLPFLSTDTRDVGNIHMVNNVGHLAGATLKQIAEIVLGRSIQEEGNDTLENARAAIDIYRLCQPFWENF